MPKKDNTKYKEYRYQELFTFWNNRISEIDKYLNSNLDLNPFDLAILMFPLLDSVAKVFCTSGLREIIENLGASKEIANMVVESCRNGYVHIGTPSNLYFNDGEVRIVEYLSKSEIIPVDYQNNKFYEYDGVYLTIYWDIFLQKFKKYIYDKEKITNNDEFVKFPIGKIFDRDKPKF